jgi:hypothetical protein
VNDQSFVHELFENSILMLYLLDTVDLPLYTSGRSGLDRFGKGHDTEGRYIVGLANLDGTRWWRKK